MYTELCPCITTSIALQLLPPTQANCLCLEWTAQFKICDWKPTALSLWTCQILHLSTLTLLPWIFGQEWDHPYIMGCTPLASKSFRNHSSETCTYNKMNSQWAIHMCAEYKSPSFLNLLIWFRLLGRNAAWRCTLQTLVQYRWRLIDSAWVHKLWTHLKKTAARPKSCNQFLWLLYCLEEQNQPGLSNSTFHATFSSICLPQFSFAWQHF